MFQVDSQSLQAYCTSTMQENTEKNSPSPNTGGGKGGSTLLSSGQLWGTMYLRISCSDLPPLCVCVGGGGGVNSNILISLTLRHRVDRGLGFSSSRTNWDLPTLSPASECSCPPRTQVGGGHTLLREKGWGSPNSDVGADTAVLYSRYICTLCPEVEFKNEQLG